MGCLQLCTAIWIRIHQTKEASNASRDKVQVNMLRRFTKKVIVYRKNKPINITINKPKTEET